jgi:glycosyltransferase involved in cell wall biosynthesis
MNICLLTSTYLPKVGGLEIVVHNLATALTQLGHNVYVVTPRPQNRRVSDRYGYKVIRFGFKGYGRLKLPSTLAVLTLAYVVKRYNIDVINAHNVFTPGSWSYYFSRLFPNTPIVGTPHGDDIQTVPEIGWGIRSDHAIDLTIRRNIKNFTLLTAISKPIFKELERTGIDKNKIRLVPNGVWTKHFQPNGSKTRIRNQLGIPEDSTVILSIGRNHPVKGYRYALKAMARLRNRGLNVLYLVLGRNMPAVVNQAQNLGLSDCLITPGEIKNVDIPNYMKASDIFVSPSIMESFGLTTLEAMSAGLPCILTDSSGIKDLIDPESGIVVEAANSAVLAEAIQYLLENPEFCKQMGLRAKIEAKKFDWFEVAKKYEYSYKKAIQEKSGMRLKVDVHRA